MRLPVKFGAGLCAAGLVVLLAAGQLDAQDKQKGKGKGKAAGMLLKVGDKAPTFQGTDDQGKAWRSSDHVGKKVVVLFFFPAALTGG